MQRPPRRRGVSKLSLSLLAVFLLLLGGAAVAGYKTLSFVSDVSTASLGDNVKSVISNSLPAPSVLQNAGAAQPAQPQLTQRVNVLLLGYGGVGHDGADLTDSMMVLSLDPKTKNAAMISVPRDIWAYIPSAGSQGGFWKINTAYAIGLDDQGFPSKRPEFTGPAGGGNLSAYVVGSILGLKIDYWAAVDFHAFTTVVDALGGVDVNVEKAFTDYQYPRNDDPSVDPGWMTIHFNAGMQHMNGQQAIEYARSRHSLEDGTDFGRSARQQRLLLAIKQKALSKDGLTKVFGLMDALSKDFKTNMTVGQIKALADAAKGLDTASIDRVSIDDTNYLADAQSADGQDILVPQGRSWTALQAHIAQLFMDPAIKTEAARVQIANGSGAPGAAGNASSMLTDIGLQMLPPENASAPVADSVVDDFSQGRDPVTVAYLADLFSARVVAAPPPQDQQADIMVVLGKNYQPPVATVDGFDPTIHYGNAPVAAATPAVKVVAKAVTTATTAATASTAPRPAASETARVVAASPTVRTAASIATARPATAGLTGVPRSSAAVSSRAVASATATPVRRG